MKRILLFIFILLSLSQAKASDTLTIRQVFNFNVGDTFDYKNQTADYDYNMFTTTYSRVVISQKAISPAGDSIIYNGTWVITNLDSIAVYQVDTLWRHGWMTNTPVYFDTITYPGYNSNQISSGSVDGGYDYTVSDSLGETIFSSSMVANNPQYTNTYVSQLVYFSNGIQHFGAPYYILEGVNNLGKNELQIKLSPNPTSDKLNLSISDAGLSNTQFIIIDILGQEIYSSPITQSESTHDISKFPSGIYTWRVMENNAIIKTGKFVKE